jgi:hypothetical protein
MSDATVRPAARGMINAAPGVHGCVHHGVEHAQDKERRGQSDPAGGEADRPEEQAEGNPRADRDATARKADDQEAGHRARDQPADRHRGDRSPESGVRQLELTLDRRQPRKHVGDSAPLTRKRALTAIRARRASRPSRVATASKGTRATR